MLVIVCLTPTLTYAPFDPQASAVLAVGPESTLSQLPLEELASLGCPVAGYLVVQDELHEADMEEDAPTFVADVWRGLLAILLAL
jgi:hypothetical protein